MKAFAPLARLDRDVRFAFRSLKRAPGFVAGVVGTIALALGLNASVFTIFNAYVLRPLAVRDPGTLYELSVSGKSDEGGWTDSWVDWDRYRELAVGSGPVVEAVAHRHVFVRINEAPAMGELVSGTYFRMLGVNAMRGRTIMPDKADVPGAGAVVVLGYSFWQSRFAADPDIVGKSISIRGTPFTVIGVLPPEFTGLRETVRDFWAPMSMVDVLEGNVIGREATKLPRVGVLIRLARGESPSTAAAMIGGRLAAATASSPPARRISSARLEPRTTALSLAPETVAIIAPIAVAFALVLVIACANVANMMLARGLARQRELGIRMALGAGRRAVVGQLLIEALVLAIPAAALGYLISRVTLDAGIRWMFATFPPAFASYLRVVDLTPDVRVFAFMGLAAFAAAILFGLAPAIQVTRTSVVAATRGEFEGGHRRGRLRDALVIAQMASCLLLLVVAGVLLRGASRAQSLDTGLRTAGLVDLEVNDAMRATVLPELRRMPGVGAVGAAIDPPVAGRFRPTTIKLAGSEAIHQVRFNRVTPEYFALLGIRIVAGRTFTPQEVAANVPVVVLSETAARRVSPSGSAIGLEVALTSSDDDLRMDRLSPFRTARVIGVAGDAVAGMVFTGRQSPVAYYPVSADASGTRLILSVSGSVDRAVRDIEKELERRSPGSVNEIYSVEGSLATQIYPMRAASWVSGLLGVVALILTLSGIYGVLSYLVMQRTAEMGIRMALGAEPRAVVGIVVGQSLRLAGIGGAIGLVLALGVSKLFSTQLEVISPFDAVAYFGSAVAALAASIIAAWVPARRAAAVDPLEALRRGG